MTGQLFGPQLVQTIINPTKFAQKIASWYEVDGTLLRDETEQAQLAQQTGEALAQSGVQGSDVATQLKEFLP